MSHLTSSAYLPQLQTFVTAYRLGSLTRAAEALGMSQPAVSGHIRALEAWLGQPLFMREPRGVRPTPLAHELARACGPGLDQLLGALEHVTQGPQQLEGSLRLAGPGEFLAEAIAPALARLHSHGLELRLLLGGRDSIYKGLAKGTVDLAITASEPQDRAYGYQLIARESLWLVGSRLLPKGAGLPGSLLRLPLLAYDEELPLIRHYFLEAFGYLPPLRAAVTAPDLRAIRALLQQGEGYSVLPDYLCREAVASGSLQLLHLPEAFPSNRLYLVWRQGELRHARLRRAKELLLEYARH